MGKCVCCDRTRKLVGNTKICQVCEKFHGHYRDKINKLQREIVWLRKAHKLALEKL